MKICERRAENFLLKSQLSDQECCKTVFQIRKTAEKMHSAIGTGLNGRGLTKQLIDREASWKKIHAIQFWKTR